MEMNTFGTNLKQLRTQRKTSQSDVAQAVGVWQSMISGIENGEKTPSLDLAFRIADYFDVTVDSLNREQFTAEPVEVEPVNA
jgi:putative transcriptional regulator